MNLKNITNPSYIFDMIRNLYASINYCRMFERSGYAISPIRYFFELTHRCNLNCSYCYVGENREKEELTTNQWLSVIEQIPFYSFVTVSGGEPLLREDFGEILTAVSRKTHGKVNVVTNGVLLNDEIIDILLQAKILLLSISLDGWGENHDKSRGKKEVFKKIEQNLHNLAQRCHIEKSKLLVDIKTIVLKDNLNDLIKLYQYASNQGFDFLSLSFLRNNNLKQNSKLYDSFDEVFYKKNYPVEPYFDLDEFEKVYWEIQKMKKFSKTRIRFAPKFDNPDPKKEIDSIKKFFSEGSKKDVKDLYEPCKYPYANTIINPEGDVYPCLSCKMGNIKEQKLQDIINNPLYRCFRKNLKYSKVFPACQMCCELKVKDQ